MTKSTDESGASRLTEVLALVRTRLAQPQRGVLERFVARYFGQVDPEDLDERTPADLYGAALSHWNFARRRVLALLEGIISLNTGIIFSYLLEIPKILVLL